ncbi:hypothetical protein pb186bvf_014494 [Paramecium bursaria]
MNLTRQQIWRYKLEENISEKIKTSIITNKQKNIDIKEVHELIIFTQGKLNRCLGFIDINDQIFLMTGQSYNGYQQRNYQLLKSPELQYIHY